jgi:hypothetical protein
MLHKYIFLRIYEFYYPHNIHSETSCSLIFLIVDPKFFVSFFSNCSFLQFILLFHCYTFYFICKKIRILVITFTFHNLPRNLKIIHLRIDFLLFYVVLMLGATYTLPTMHHQSYHGHKPVYIETCGSILELHILWLQN